MAFTDDFTVGGTLGLSQVASRPIVQLENEIDFAEDNLAQYGLRALLNIPADTFLLEMILDVETAEGGTATADIGDYLASDESAVDADGWFNDVNLNSAAVSKALGGGAAYGLTVGKYYTAASVIALYANHALDAAKIRIKALCIDCRDAV